MLEELTLHEETEKWIVLLIIAKLMFAIWTIYYMEHFEFNQFDFEILIHETKNNARAYSIDVGFFLMILNL